MLRKIVIWYLKKKIEYYKSQIRAVEAGVNRYITADTAKEYKEDYLRDIKSIEDTIEIL